MPMTNDEFARHQARARNVRSLFIVAGVLIAIALVYHWGASDGQSHTLTQQEIGSTNAYFTSVAQTETAWAKTPAPDPSWAATVQAFCTSINGC